MVGVQLEHEAVAAPVPVPAPAALVSASVESPAMPTPADAPLVVVSDPWLVQFADLTVCDVDGCAEAAVPEAWALIDFDTGEELPGRFCDVHELAYLTRPCTPTIIS